MNVYRTIAQEHPARGWLAEPLHLILLRLFAVLALIRPPGPICECILAALAR